MHIKTQGIVLRETNYKEADKILNVLTPEGKITVSARGARRKGSRISAACQLFALSEMELFKYKDRYSLNEAEVKEQFLGLRSDIKKFALAAYFMELAETIVNEAEESSEILALTLNSLYVLETDIKSETLIKAVFELRVMAIAGFEPRVDCCAICGDVNPEHPRLSITQGVLCCANCRPAEGVAMPLEMGALDAMRYVINADNKKLFSFRLSDRGLRLLGNATEAFVQVQLERSFKTLDFYKNLN